MLCLQIHAIQNAKVNGGGDGAPPESGGGGASTGGGRGREDAAARHLDGAAVQLRPGYREKLGASSGQGVGLSVDCVDEDEEFDQVK